MVICSKKRRVYLQGCAIHLVEALLQICEMFPHFLPGSSATPPLLVFGEHTGGAAALAVAWQVGPALLHRGAQVEEYRRQGVLAGELHLAAVGLGNPFLSAK